MKKSKKMPMSAIKMKKHLRHDVRKAKEGIAEDKGLIKALRGKSGRKGH